MDVPALLSRPRPDLTAGPHVTRFIETFLTLGASHLGQPFHLRPWQRAVLDDLYALQPDGRRQHRTYVLGLPRKNGKSQLGAAVALYHLIADPADTAPQVISAAGDRKQARLVFDEAARMVRASPDLSDVCTVYRNEILCHRNGGVYRAVSADAGLQQGLNPSMVVMDELHVHKNPDLYEALSLGSATRNQPLMLVISTAGYDLESPLGVLYQHGLQVLSGETEDPSFGMTWLGPEPGEDIDPAAEETWARFNPALGDFQSIDDFRSSYRTTHEAAFIRYRLNGWTAAANSWLPHGVWDALQTDRRLEPGEAVVLGFDGAWKGDSTALVACSLEDFHLEVLGHWEAPAGDQHWRAPVAEVEEAIRRACRRFKVREVTADPYRWEQSLTALAEEGYPVVEFPTNSVARMVPATQAFYDAVRDGHLTHDGSPALARHLANAVLKEDHRGGRITKAHPDSKQHIDLAVAALVAHHRARSYRELTVREPRLLVL